MACGMAVLRGANIFIAGILATSQGNQLSSVVLRAYVVIYLFLILHICIHEIQACCQLSILSSSQNCYSLGLLYP